MPKITIYHPDGERSKFELNKRLVSIGRGTDNDIVLPDGSSSSNHAIFKMNPEGDFGVTDLGSTNHTKVNGVRVTTAELLDNDEIYFGDTRATYHSEVSAGKGGAMRKAPGNGAAATAEPRKLVSPKSFSAEEKGRAGAATPEVKEPESMGAGGCFALLMLPLLMVVCLFLGMSVRHYFAADKKFLHEELITLFQESRGAQKPSGNSK